MGLKEVIVVGVVILLLFGGSILPRLARSSAKRMKGSKDTLLATKTELEAGLRDLHGENDEDAAVKTPEPAAPTNRAPSR